MENRTVVFKDMISKLEALSTENYNYADMQKLISTAKTVLDAGKTIMESVKDVKTQLKNQFEDQSKKFVDLSNEKLKKDLGIDRTGIEEVINKKENEDDFERIIDIGKKIMEYECRKLYH